MVVGLSLVSHSQAAQPGIHRAAGQKTQLGKAPVSPCGLERRLFLTSGDGGHLDCTHLESAVVMVVGLSLVSHSHSRNSKQTTCLWRDTGGKGKVPTQHTTFNTLDNWAINPPPNQKGKGPERKGYRVMARNMYTIHSVTLRYSMSVIIILNQG